MAKFQKLIRCSVLAVIVLITTSFSLNAKTINCIVATGHPSIISWVKILDEYFLPEVNSRLAATNGKYEIRWNKAYGGAVAKIGGVLEAVESGVVDMGIVGAVFEPGNLPLQIVSFYAPFATTDISTAVTVMDEMHRDIPALRESWGKFNQVYLASLGALDVNLFTKYPTKRFEDIKGMKIGGAGPNLNWLKGAGVAGVQINITTIYNDLATGIYEGVLLTPDTGYAIKLHEVTPYYLKVGFGAVVWGGLSANRDFWNSLPNQVRKIFYEVAKDYQKKLIQFQINLGEKGLEKMKEKGLKVLRLQEQERNLWARSLPNIAKEWAEPLEKKGMPAKQVVKYWIKKVQKDGSKPVRDWAGDLN